ncbi:hypothetical protein A2303_06505 [Candidatus Falkowbacteria bacterium RIFOXYB2_FULL_47_14]|uniref:Sulfatase-modifying factor enzyme-like domain-containing protein n=1 Tax=Candidatus Falkowbacteria bacterium RIFOXYA2_FULL_47_19 TaxID=1797994 RepID=A0A1F5SE09_9BACT|nr:MAG: hypothetical protein A2227_04570 [Candidatus Falkowbacteria bacterium RIFOXYA2_FULL_47_19]OGF35674.1 MAG: hypothetical protein A2468_04470 [Candidatus Falkowbacteria bacterium RIFOXYC2_FULL_46_15]OGF43190.1 MAG: hypothetical protein A2303_06505 [Candidatus Falkowbacteria bacterium RIFOXYB2_FULL_47_14]
MKKKFFSKILVSLIIGIIAVILVTIGIDAADNYDNFSGSIIGRVLYGEDEGPCPDGMVFVPSDKGGFCIDKYENSPGDGCSVKNVSSQNETRDNIDKADCEPVSRAEASPWRFISQSQAIAACAKAGKRLPTGEEWYLASLGTPDPDRDWGPDDCQVNANWPDQPGLSGSGKNCVSAAGAYDMVGNVWEWVKEEIRDGQYGDLSAPLNGYISSIDIHGMPLATDTQVADPNFNEDYFWVKNTDIRGMMRGGYWENKSDAGLYSVYLVSPPDFAGTGAGFRCVK